MEKKLEWKDFDKDDWEAWAGAENFGSGADPIIAYPNDNKCIIIADSRGICYYDEEMLESGDGDAWMIDLPNCTEAVIKAVANALPEQINADVLEKFGFRKE